MLSELIYELSKDPFNSKLNFQVALEYEKSDQLASAVSFYLRSAEYGEDSGDLHVYTALLKLAKCFNEQNDRENTVTNCLMQAIAYLPERPEGYFLLSQFHERQASWHAAYLYAGIGLNCPNHFSLINPLPADVGFVHYGLDFERAVAAWWIGRRDESVCAFNELLELEISDQYRSVIEANLAAMGAPVSAK